MPGIASAIASTANEDPDRLSQAARILAHLQQQLAELDRRERQLQQQAALIAERQRDVQRSAAHAQRQQAEQRQLLETLAAALTDREESLQLRIAALTEDEDRHAAQAEALEQAKTQFQEQQRLLREQLYAEMEEDRRELDAAQTAFQEELASRRAELEATAEQQQTALLQSQDRLRAERAEYDRLSSTWNEERQRQRKLDREELERVSRDRLAALDQRESELQRREIDLQKRFRLHESHLERMRGEVAAQRRRWEVQQQRQRVWREQTEDSIRLRLEQMRKFRDVLADREQALDLERQAFESRCAALTEEQQQRQLAAQAARQQQQELLDQEIASLQECTKQLHGVLQSWTQAEEAAERLEDFEGQNTDAMTTLASELQHMLQGFLGAIQERSGWVAMLDAERADHEAACEEERQHRRLDRLRWQQERLAAEQVMRELIAQVEQLLSERDRHDEIQSHAA